MSKVSVNEAAAQICRLVPAMLTRRDELFPLARQVVRDSGYQYSKGHSRSVITDNSHNSQRLSRYSDLFLIAGQHSLYPTSSSMEMKVRSKE